MLFEWEWRTWILPRYNLLKSNLLQNKASSLSYTSIKACYKFQVFPDVKMTLSTPSACAPKLKMLGLSSLPKTPGL
jgi:hypothetical protein